MRVRNDITLPEQLLRHAVPLPRNLSVPRPRVEVVRPLPVHRFAKLGEQEDPVGLDAAARVRVQRERVEPQVLAAFGPDGLVADLHGARVGDAVESQPQPVLAVVADLRATGLRAIVERGFGAETLDVLEVVGRTGCDGDQTRSFNGQFESVRRAKKHPDEQVRFQLTDV